MGIYCVCDHHRAVIADLAATMYAPETVGGAP